MPDRYRATRPRFAASAPGLACGLARAVRPAASLARRRTDAPGTVKLTDRDITGLTLCAYQYGAPHDLLAAALNVREERPRGIIARWRHAGYAGVSVMAHR